MKKTYLLSCSLLLSKCIATQTPECTASVDTQDQRTFNIHINQTIAQDMNINNENSIGNTSKKCKCSDYFGAKLIECMKSIHAHEVKENFVRLTPKSAYTVLQAFDTQQTTELVAYFTKEEWHEWYEKLPQEIQNKIGSTREETIRSARRRELYKDLLDTIKGLILL